MSGLVENFIRRIEKLLDVRATIPAQGTNHVDDTWLNSDIYPGELSVRVDTGSLYTSNGVAVIDLNREDLILHGLNLKKDTAGQNKLTVTSGSARINGGTYDFISSGTDIYLPFNVGVDPILYFIYGNTTSSISSNPGNYLLGLTAVGVPGSLDESGIFTDITGNEDYPVPPNYSLLLGAVVVKPGAFGYDLQPLSVTTLGDYYPKFSTTSSEFLRTVSKQVTPYLYTSLYVPGQFVIDHASNTTYVSKRLFVSDQTSISTDVTNGNLVQTAGGGGGGGSYTALSLGTGAAVYKTTVSTQFQFRSLTGSYPVILTQNTNDITIGLSMSAFVGSITNIGTGENIYAGITSGIARLKSLTAGSNVTLTNTGNEIRINVPAIGTTAQGRNLGATMDADIYTGMTGINLGFRRLQMGAGMTATQYSDYITLSTTVKNNSGINLSGGAPLYYGMSGDNLSFRSLTAGSNITITNVGNQIQISSAGGGGSITGGVNIGASGGEIFAGPLGSGLSFRSITPGFGIAVTQVGNDVQIDATISNGAQGVQGFQGPLGYQGVQGFQGFQGPQGLSGTDGTNGLQGRQGPFGPQGVDGPIGQAGAPGLNAPLGTQRLIELYDSAGGATVASTTSRILNLDTIRLNTDSVLYQVGTVSQILPDGTYVQIAESGSYKFDFTVTLQLPTNTFAIAYIFNNTTGSKVVGSDAWFNTRSGTQTVTVSSNIVLSVNAGSRYSIRLESISGAGTTQQFASSLAIYKLEIGMGFQGFQGPRGDLGLAFVTGTAGTDFTINSIGSTHTFNIPNAGLGVSRGLITNGTQTIYGAKTFNNGRLLLTCTNNSAETSSIEGTTNGFYFRNRETLSLYHYLANGRHVMWNAAGTFYGNLETSFYTADRTHTLPDASGTLALTSDISNAQRITSLGGLTASIQTFATGTTGTDFTINSTGSTHTFNLPDAGTAARGVVTVDPQSFSGYKNFTDNIVVNGITIWRGDNNSATSIGIGLNTLLNSTGNQNTIIGYQALAGPTASSSFNTVLGYQAYSNGAANNNTAIGWKSLFSSAANNNSALGYSSGLLLTTGFQNTFIGSFAGGTSGQKIDAQNSIAIGYNSFTTKNNQVVLGNSSIVETFLRGKIVLETSPTGSTGAYDILTRNTSTGFIEVLTTSIQGPQGFQGPQGLAGTLRGPQGFQGVQGATGPTLYSINYKFTTGAFTPLSTDPPDYYIGDWPDTNPAAAPSNKKGQLMSMHTGFISEAIVSTAIGINSNGPETSTLYLRNVTTGATGMIASAFSTNVDDIVNYMVTPPLPVTIGDRIGVVFIRANPFWTGVPPDGIRFRINTKMLTNTTT